MRGATHLLIWLLAWFCLPLHARDLAAYRVGDVADEDIIAPVPLDVVDPAATAALKLAKAQQYPAIFRSFSNATNIMAGDFLTAFAQARSNFLAEAATAFHPVPLDQATIGSADFGRLVTAFGVENKNFPITDALAAEWARGRDGETIRDEILARLQWAANRPVQPDGLPKDMFIGESVRLVPVADPEQKLSFETVQQGELVPAASLMTVANARALFRREFPAEQQLVARTLAAFLQPNCFPDALFTQLTRGAAVLKVVVSEHFDAGDAIVRQGDRIDAKIKAALDALHDKQIEKPVAAPATLATSEPTPPQSKPEPTPAEATPPPALAVVPKSNPAPATVARAPAGVPPKSAAPAGTRHMGMIALLAGTSIAWLLVAWWQFSKQRKKKAAATPPAAQAPLPFVEAAKDNLAPQVTQAVREAVQQELTMQRRELLVAQQAATSEIAALVHRLDELQVPMQQRLQTYESRIQALEKELALRNEENRELLKMKIEMVTRQLETERAATLVPPMAA